MTHRTKVFSLDKRERVKDAFPAMLEAGFSRVPVYDEDPERIVGIALLKDISMAVAAGNSDQQISRLMANPVYVHETWPVDQVLTRLRRERLNMAVVLDEYGGVSGLVTMEDLVEVFVGDLYDEGEVIESQRVTRVNENEFLIRSETPIFVVNDQLDVDIPSSGEAQTIGGFVTEHLDRIPSAGDQVDLHDSVIIVDKVSESRVVMVRFLKKHR